MVAIYHITHIENLSSILQDECLWCDTERLQRGLASVGIAHTHIKARRARREVPVCRGGVLADYVPFYFAPRSPMLYSIYKGNVAGYSGGQSRVIHLVSSVETVIENRLPYAFTNGHAEMAVTNFYENTEDLDKVDWSVMRGRVWNDTVTDGNRKWRRQAEFLVHNAFPFSLFNELGVISQRVADEAQNIMSRKGYDLAVKVQQNWYY